MYNESTPIGLSNANVCLIHEFAKIYKKKGAKGANYEVNGNMHITPQSV